MVYENGVTLRYTGTNRGAIQFVGVDRKRAYRVAAGTEIVAHPDDVARLEGLGKFERVQVVPEAVPAEDASKVEAKATAVPEGYDEMNAEEAIAALEGLSDEALRAVATYEQGHKNRVTVLRAIEGRLKGE